VPLKRKCASAFWKDIIIRHNISCFITKNFKPGLLHWCQNICDMLESLSYKCSPCRIYCIFLGVFVHWGLKKLYITNGKFFVPQKPQSFLEKNHWFTPFVSSLHLLAGIVLFCLYMNMFCSLHFIQFHSIVSFIGSLLHSHRDDGHNSIPQVHPLAHFSILACSGCEMDLCRTGSLVYKHLLTYISYLVYKPYPFSVGSFFEGFMAPAKS
jgi:hypothetical protein